MVSLQPVSQHGNTDLQVRHQLRPQALILIEPCTASRRGVRRVGDAFVSWRSDQCGGYIWEWARTHGYYSVGVAFGSGSGHARLLTINDTKNDFDEASSSEWFVGDPAHCFAVEEEQNRVVGSASTRSHSGCVSEWMGEWWSE